jgi:thiol-disulfide isomerase/thioredoxin
MKVFDEKSNNMMLVGESPRKAYQDEDFAIWFNSEYTNYIVNSEALEKSKKNIEGKVIRIVLGTWCPDSRREVPRFIKILDFLNFPDDKVLFINVDRNKKGLRDEIDGLEINFVPTFIIYENGREIGRIIEKPEVSLEKDLSKIVN